jgi:hypothetical protein
MVLPNLIDQPLESVHHFHLWRDIGWTWSTTRSAKIRSSSILESMKVNAGEISEFPGTRLKPRHCACMRTDEEAQAAIDAIYQTLLESDIVQGPDELYALVEELWPQLLHRLKPPRWRMH